MWCAPGRWPSVCPGALGPPEGAVSGLCVCVCVCAPRVFVCGARARNKLSRRRPLPSRVGPGLRLGREKGGPAAADSDMSGCLLFRKFCAALAAGCSEAAPGPRGARGRWRGGPGAGGGRRGPRGARGGRAGGRSCGAPPGLHRAGGGGGRAADAVAGRGCDVPARAGPGPRPPVGAPSRGGQEAPRTPGSPGTLPRSTPQLCAASLPAGTAVCASVYVCERVSPCFCLLCDRAVCVFAYLNVRIGSLCLCVRVCCGPCVGCVRVSDSPPPSLPGAWDPRLWPPPAELCPTRPLGQGWPGPLPQPHPLNPHRLGGCSLVPRALSNGETPQAEIRAKARAGPPRPGRDFWPRASENWPPRSRVRCPTAPSGLSGRAPLLLPQSLLLLAGSWGLASSPAQPLPQQLCPLPHPEIKQEGYYTPPPLDSENLPVLHLLPAGGLSRTEVWDGSETLSKLLPFLGSRFPHTPYGHHNNGA